MDNPTLYSVDGSVYEATDPRLQSVLAAAYTKGIKPRCMCKPGGVEMYLARYDNYVIKRMPETGTEHHPTCVSYDPPLELSGRSEVFGDSIFETESGDVTLMSSIRFQRIVGRSVSPGEVHEPTQVEAARRTLGLTGIWHLLLEMSRFNRWSPLMEGKRNYYVFRKHIRQAGQRIKIKGRPLTDRMYIPEAYRREDHDAIVKRSRETLAPLFMPDGEDRCNLILVLGELKDLTDAAIDVRVTLKHMPWCDFFIERNTAERFRRTCRYEYETWRQSKEENKGDLRYIIVGTVFAKRENAIYFDTLSLMMLDASWIPLESVYEKQLLDVLQQDKRRFVKPLHYESRNPALYPNFILLDAGDVPVPLDIVSPFMPAKSRAAKRNVAASRKPGWLWSADEGVVIPPPLPAPQHQARTATVAA